jgi:hypothetical protein
LFEIKERRWLTDLSKTHLSAQELTEPPTRLAVELNPVGEDVEYSLVKPSPVTLEN